MRPSAPTRGPYSVDMAKLWGHLKTQARKSGHSLGQNDHTNDLWIATAAIFYDAPLPPTTGHISKACLAASADRLMRSNTPAAQDG